MLKKILYNKYLIDNIPKELEINSEEFLKILFDLKNVIMFKYKKDKTRLLGYSGYNIDWLGRATKFQPIPRGGDEVYRQYNKDEIVLYQENVLRGSFSSYSFVGDDIDNYVAMINAFDEAIIFNANQIYIPFIAKTKSTNQAQMLRSILAKTFGEKYKSLIVECKATDDMNGTIIETTNIQLFTEMLQNTKKKILDEAFLYLGVARPTGKLTHESELEVSQESQIPDLLDKIMFDKIALFIAECNEKFGFNMIIKKKIGG